MKSTQLTQSHAKIHPSNSPHKKARSRSGRSAKRERTMENARVAFRRSAGACRKRTRCTFPDAPRRRVRRRRAMSSSLARPLAGSRVTLPVALPCTAKRRASPRRALRVSGCSSCTRRDLITGLVTSATSAKSQDASLPSRVATAAMADRQSRWSRDPVETLASFPSSRSVTTEFLRRSSRRWSLTVTGSDCSASQHRLLPERCEPL